ncbi:putative nuclease HARBI1 [Dermacentor andersoni]|uniref:putative nuclease HARBI1 n=1 Tax=Dermacentor andersoni TaxID=34620 RepID=UPI003B3B7631
MAAAKRCRLDEELLLLFDEDSSCSTDSSTSSSSDSSGDDEDLALYEQMFEQLFTPPEKRPKVESYVEKTVAAFSDEEFAKSPHYASRTDRGGLPPKSPQEHVQSFLWYATNKSCIRDVAGRFEVGESTHHTMMYPVMAFLLDIAPRIVTFPDDLQKLANALEQVSGFPDTIGGIDGSYIPVRCPAGKVRSVYVNGHYYPSLMLQGICDNWKRFLDARTGAPSKIHDSRIFWLSNISKKLPQLSAGKYHILGDAAYPSREFLMTPIRDYGSLDASDKAFNTKLSSTCVLTENAFGEFKGRFRQLQRLDLTTVDKMSKFILSCCVLHNICIDNGESFHSPLEDMRLSSQVNNDQSPTADEVCSGTSREESLLRALAEVKKKN